MKKIIVIFSIFLLLTACTKNKNNNEDKKMKSKDKINALKLYDDLYLLESEGKFVTPVNLSGINEELENGQIIEIEKNIPVAKSFPGQANLESYEKSEKAKSISIDINFGEMIFSLDESKIQLVDVREKDEYQQGHLKSAVNLPLSEIKNGKIEGISKEKPVFVYCRSGKRSAEAQKYLEENGYFVINIGGVLDYKGELVK